MVTACVLQDSWTPLHVALVRKNMAVAQTVLDYRPDVDIQDRVRHTHAVVF